MIRCRRWMPGLAASLVLAATGLPAQELGGSWQALGPGPVWNGQTEIPAGEVVGAVNAIAAHPTNADILYVGGTEGGIWRTDNATAESPTWVAQTDALDSLSIGALEFDPTDASAQTLVAGIAHSSSYTGYSSELIGLIRTTDGGASWVGFNSTAGVNLYGVAGRGSVLLAAGAAGVLRSADAGATFVGLSGVAGTGLPEGFSSDLAGDPTNPSQFYLPVHGSAQNGIYRSTNLGANWVKVSDASLDAALGPNISKVKIAVGSSGQVFVGIVDNGRLSAVFRSANGSSPWVSLGVPTTVEQNGIVFGIHPGSQGRFHFSIVADPSNSNVVYVGGDRQPAFGEGVPGSTMYFPNSIGASNYTGRLFRGDASQPPGSRWVPLTHVGTASNSAPHADSRDMAFDAQGSLIESNDGGVYKRLSPQSSSGDWESINGDLQTAEYHGVAWDGISHRVVGGSQDNGTSEMILPNWTTFQTVSGGDGGDPAIADGGSTTHSVRYSSAQFLNIAFRREVDADNNSGALSFLALTPVDGSPALEPDFYSPLATHYDSQDRLLIGAANGLYESMDRGDTVALIGNGPTPFAGDPLVYGAEGDPEFVLVGSYANVYVRRGGSTNFIDLGTPTAPFLVWDVDADRSASNRLFVNNLFSVYFSNDGGASFNDVTGNLTAIIPGALLRSMAYIGSIDALAVGTTRGVYLAYGNSGFRVWHRLGSSLPNAPVNELEFDAKDNLLVAGLLGRGAWKLEIAEVPADSLHADGFEQIAGR